MTVLHAGSAPLHVASHRPVPQLSVPHAALPPAQSALQSPVVQLIEPHAPAPMQVASQSPLVQVMLPHACAPVHSTWQSFVLHVMPRQAEPAEQVTSHDAAFAQLIVPHAPDVPHSMLQFQPLGHVMLPLPVPTIVQLDVVKLHVPAQISGHTAASSGRDGASMSGFCPITQKPCVHTRSDEHSELEVHL